MKYRLLGIILAAFVLMPAFGQKIEFFAGSFDEIKAKAKAEKKDIFLDIYTSWCGPCKKMASQVFTNPDVANYFNSNFVCVKLDAEKEKEHGFFSKYTAEAFPSFFWLNADGELLDTKTGYREPADFIQTAKDAKKSTLSQDLKNAEARWAKGDREVEFVKKYLFDILPQLQPQKMRPLFNEYLSGLTQEQLRSKETGSMLNWFLRDVTDDLAFKTFLMNNDCYQKSIGLDDYGRVVYRTLVRIPMAQRENPEEYNATMSVIRKYDFPNKDMYLSIIEMEKLLFNKEYSKGIASALSIGKKYQSEFPYLYNEFIYTLIISRFFEESYTPSAAEIKGVIDLGERALELTPSKASLMYLAAAYARNKDYKRSYELLANEPFFGEPVLSNAVYYLLNLSKSSNTEFGKTDDCKVLKEKFDITKGR